MGDHVVKHAKISTASNISTKPQNLNTSIPAVSLICVCMISDTGSTRVVEPMEHPLYGKLSRPYRLWLTPGTVLLYGHWLRRHDESSGGKRHSKFPVTPMKTKDYAMPSNPSTKTPGTVLGCSICGWSHFHSHFWEYGLVTLFLRLSCSVTLWLRRM